MRPSFQSALEKMGNARITDAGPMLGGERPLLGTLPIFWSLPEFDHHLRSAPTTEWPHDLRVFSSRSRWTFVGRSRQSAGRGGDRDRRARVRSSFVGQCQRLACICGPLFLSLGLLYQKLGGWSFFPPLTGFGWAHDH